MAQSKTKVKAKSATSKSVELTFDFEKETPGTLRFKEQGDEPVVGAIYIKKDKVQSALGTKKPKSITVVISR